MQTEKLHKVELTEQEALVLERIRNMKDGVIYITYEDSAPVEITEIPLSK